MRSSAEVADEIASLRTRLAQLEAELEEATESSTNGSPDNVAQISGTKPDRKRAGEKSTELPMPLEEYLRYGRQMILPDIGLQGQLRLRRSSICVIGAGGLGCPALLYLGGAGVGAITILDHDTVEVSNLHRQVLHTVGTVGQNKAVSARTGLLARNPSLHVTAIQHALSPALFSDAHSPLGKPFNLSHFSLVLDCSDNAPSRYLLSDVCAAAGVPLVSGAAIRSEGQVTVWNLPPAASGARGPCMRCVFPESPEPATGGRCEDEGVLGPAVGVTGILMAWEALKLLLDRHDRVPRLLLIPSFRTVKLRRRQESCPGCGPMAASRLEALIDGRTAWSAGACEAGDAPDASSEPRVRPKDLDASRYRIVDVRPETEYGICALPVSQNVPLSDLLARGLPKTDDAKPVLLVCRRGNDSLTAARHLRQTSVDAVDLVGGLRAYSRHVDPSFPVY